MTLVGPATRPSDGADPRRTQKRVAVSPSGRQVLVDISGDDRLRLIKTLPGRWPEVMMRRESGEELDSIARWTKVPTPCRPACSFAHVAASPEEGIVRDAVHVGEPCLRYHVAGIYAWLETELHDLAARRAKLMA
jgi:hypothetical protein